MELSERIIQARKQAGLTQEQLGEKLGVSRQAVSKWESGQANPDVAYIMEMCRLFDVSADWLLLGAETFEKAETGKICPQCGTAAGEQDRFCSHCGTSLEEEHLMGRCPECGTPLSAETAYCTKCGRQMDDTYTLYLRSTTHDPDLLAERLHELLLNDWVEPAFTCGEITVDVAKHLVQNAAPLVLCQGLTYKQALRSMQYFDAFPDTLKIYRDSDIVLEPTGILRPGAPSIFLSASEVQEKNEPLSGGAIFGLVVLGVIVAILIMSIF